MSLDLVEIRLGARAYGMRPSMEVYRDIEARCQLTLRELYELALNQRLKLEEMAMIVLLGTKAAGESLDAEGISVCLFQGPVTNPELRGAILKFLMAMMYTPEEAIKKFDAGVSELLKAQAESI